MSGFHSPRSDRAPAWRRYVRFWRTDPDADVQEEVRFHVEELVTHYVAEGMTPDAARAAALRRFGNVGDITSTLRHLSHQRERRLRVGEWIESFGNDLRYGVRQLAASPGFTIVAMATLALGIGANSAIFSVVHSVLLRPLPFANADRILRLDERFNGGPMGVTYGNFDVWQRTARQFERFGATAGSIPYTLTGAGDPTPLPSIAASAGYWRTLYIPPAAGRYFTDAEDQPGGPNVVVLSYAAWRNRFGGDPAIAGRSITLNGQPFTVVGVAAPEYVMEAPIERIWVPLAPPAWRLADHADHELTVYGLVRQGVPDHVAVRELTSIETGLARQYPNSNNDGGIVSQRLADSVVGPIRTQLLIIVAAVVLVLLIACVNVANLLIARAATRHTEIAVRGALGATRGRIVTQLVAESLLIALGGGALGLALAVGALRFLVTSPAAVPRLRDATLNLPVVGFTIALTLVCTVVFGLLPAVRASREDLQQTLREGGRASGARVGERLRATLVVGELVLAQVLLVGAGLFIRSSMLLSAVSPGFSTENLLVFDVTLPSARYRTQAAAEVALHQIEASLAALPGVRSAGRASIVPIHSTGWNCGAFREGSDGHDAGATDADVRSASPSYFGALGVPMLRGRTFTDADVAGSAPVAVITRELGRKLFGDADPVGKSIANCVSSSRAGPVWREIVGVAGDIRAAGLADPPRSQFYFPTTQWMNRTMSFVVRGAVPVTSVVPSIRRAVAATDPLLALSNLRTMDEALAARLALPRFITWLLTLLGAAGLALATVGVYGVIAYFVSRRTHELGLRIALGATPSLVRRMVVRQGFALAAAGVVIGTGVSAAATQVIATLLYGVTAHDALTYVGVALLLGVVALLASYLPARRATRIDPLSALRAD